MLSLKPFFTMDLASFVPWPKTGMQYLYNSGAVQQQLLFHPLQSLWHGALCVTLASSQHAEALLCNEFGLSRSLAEHGHAI